MTPKLAKMLSRLMTDGVIDTALEDVAVYYAMERLVDLGYAQKISPWVYQITDDGMDALEDK